MQMTDGLFRQGVELMLAGIGSVFVFLVVLVIATRAMSWALNWHRGTPPDTVSEAHIAAISAAVDQYRRGRGGSE